MKSSACCVHFGDCGGCQNQHLPYSDQLLQKEESVRSLFVYYDVATFHPILPSPNQWYYRNRMEFVFSGTAGAVALGLRRKGRFWDVVDLRECSISFAEVGEVLDAVKHWANKQDMVPYDLKSGRGFLRYLVLREGKNTGERLLNLVTAEGSFDQSSFLSAVDCSSVHFNTVVWSVNSALTDTARGNRRALLRGEGVVTERINGENFFVSENTFFQTNTGGTEVLYNQIGRFLPEGASVLFDLYCGSGTIGLSLAERARRVVGIEINPQSVEDAKTAARLQGCSAASFYHMDCARLLKDEALMSLWKESGAIAVVDPPRAGLDIPLRQLLLKYPIADWVYVSCNPKALARDLPVLNDVYAISHVAPVDMFPHTDHVETVVHFTRRGIKK